MTARHRCAAAGLPLLVCLLASAGSACRSGRAGEKAAAQKPVKVKVVPVESRTVQRSVEAVGSLFPFEEVTVSSEVEGRIDSVYVDVGDKVASGRPLVKIIPVELSLALDQEHAALKQIETRLAPPEGQAALKDPREAAEVRRAEADRTDAAQKYERAKELWDQGLIARGAFDEAEARYNSARAAYDMALQNVRTLQAQAVQRSASVALAEKKLGDTVIRAPFAGQVKERMVSPGQYVKVQTPAMVLVDNDPLRVRLKVPERMAGWVAVGQPVTVQVEAYPGPELRRRDLAHQPLGRPAVARVRGRGPAEERRRRPQARLLRARQHRVEPRGRDARRPEGRAALPLRRLQGLRRRGGCPQGDGSEGGRARGR